MGDEPFQCPIVCETCRIIMGSFPSMNELDIKWDKCSACIEADGHEKPQGFKEDNQ